MGSANYYLQARFSSEEAAALCHALYGEMIKPFLEDIDFGFKVEDGDPEAFAHTVDFQATDLDWRNLPETFAECRGIRLNARAEAWHLADWTPLTEWFKAHGAVDAYWWSDEYYPSQVEIQDPTTGEWLYPVMWTSPWDVFEDVNVLEAAVRATGRATEVFKVIWEGLVSGRIKPESLYGRTL